eukprot:759846-Hanusia_phi.AAC.5
MSIIGSSGDGKTAQVRYDQQSPAPIAAFTAQPLPSSAWPAKNRPLPALKPLSMKPFEKSSSFGFGPSVQIRITKHTTTSTGSASAAAAVEGEKEVTAAVDAAEQTEAAAEEEVQNSDAAPVKKEKEVVGEGEAPAASGSSSSDEASATAPVETPEAAGGNEQTAVKEEKANIKMRARSSQLLDRRNSRHSAVALTDDHSTSIIVPKDKRPGPLLLPLVLASPPPFNVRIFLPPTLPPPSPSLE